MKGTWFDAFRRNMNVLFTEVDFVAYSRMVKGELPLYQKYLQDGDRILDVGCGLGCTAVPLSREGFRVVGIDNDERVIEAVRENGQRFGGTVEFLLMDAFEVDMRFEKDSFDACIHGGFLEHFSKEQIKTLVRKQLYVAPLVLCWVPVRTRKTLEHYGVMRVDNSEICADGIPRNLWTEEEWIIDVLKDFEIIETGASECAPEIGNFDELFVVIKK